MRTFRRFMVRSIDRFIITGINFELFCCRWGESEVGVLVILFRYGGTFMWVMILEFLVVVREVFRFFLLGIWIEFC